MSINYNDFLPGKVSTSEIDDMVRLGELSTQITVENVHDGSETSREYAQLAVKIIDEYLNAMEFFLASPFLREVDRENLEKQRAIFLSKRANAQRAVELNG